MRCAEVRAGDHSPIALASSLGFPAWRRDSWRSCWRRSGCPTRLAQDRPHQCEEDLVAAMQRNPVQRRALPTPRRISKRRVAALWRPNASASILLSLVFSRQHLKTTFSLPAQNGDWLLRSLADDVVQRDSWGERGRPYLVWHTRQAVKGRLQLSIAGPDSACSDQRKRQCTRTP